jgi:hypothetical protein
MNTAGEASLQLMGCRRTATAIDASVISIAVELETMILNET